MYYAITKRTVIGPHIATGAWVVILSLLPGWYWKGQSRKTPGKQQQWTAPSFSSEPVETHPPEPWWSPPLCKTKGKACNPQLDRVNYLGFKWNVHKQYIVVLLNRAQSTLKVWPLVLKQHFNFLHQGKQHHAISRWIYVVTCGFTWLSIPSISNIEKNRIDQSGEIGSCVTACG